jgi:hypothetical protein
VFKASDGIIYSTGGFCVCIAAETLFMVKWLGVSQNQKNGNLSSFFQQRVKMSVGCIDKILSSQNSRCWQEILICVWQVSEYVFYPKIFPVSGNPGTFFWKILLKNKFHTFYN